MKKKTVEVQQFEVGDLVMLKSGSPVMTVDISDSNEVKCVYWNSQTNEFSEDTFHPSTLVEKS